MRKRITRRYRRNENAIAREETQRHQEIIRKIRREREQNE